LTRCVCGNPIFGQDCPHCPPVKYVNCPKCGKLVAIVNEATKE
jgi:hypothetical protein